MLNAIIPPKLANHLKKDSKSDDDLSSATEKTKKALDGFGRKIERHDRQLEPKEQEGQLLDLSKFLNQACKSLKGLNPKGSKRLRSAIGKQLRRTTDDDGRRLSHIGKEEIETFLERSKLIQESVSQAIQRGRDKARKDRKDGIAELSSLARSFIEIWATHCEPSLTSDKDLCGLLEAALAGYKFRQGSKLKALSKSIGSAISRARREWTTDSSESDKDEDDD